jgi:peroxiredoxin
VPTALVGVDGTTVDVASLASSQRVFFVTLKATWCPVCQVQLRRLTALLPRLRSCGATFVVLGPGPRADLLRIAKETAFPFPFVEDVGLSVARGVSLELAADQIEPAILEVNAGGEVVWMQRGRADGAFGDAALLERLDCGELKTAASRSSLSS